MSRLWSAAVTSDCEGAPGFWGLFDGGTGTGWAAGGCDPGETVGGFILGEADG